MLTTSNFKYFFEIETGIVFLAHAMNALRITVDYNNNHTFFRVKFVERKNGIEKYVVVSSWGENEIEDVN